MPGESKLLHLPSYSLFMEALSPLALPFSASELHGMLTAYLCGGAIKSGEKYLHALMANLSGDQKRTATLALFGVYAVIQQQLKSFNFDFQLLLPDEEEPLKVRAQAFSEWCAGFTQTFKLLGIDHHGFADQEASDLLLHISEFITLDYESLDDHDDSERALMDISEYTRMGVIHMHDDLVSSKLDPTSVAH
ncbi:MAG: UPF0149 family protein [Legionella sp.]